MTHVIHPLKSQVFRFRGVKVPIGLLRLVDSGGSHRGHAHPAPHEEDDVLGLLIGVHSVNLVK